MQQMSAKFPRMLWTTQKALSSVISQGTYRSVGISYRFPVLADSENSLLRSSLPILSAKFTGGRLLSGGHEHAHSHGHENAPKVPVTFIYEKDGRKQTVQGSVGMNLLRVAHANDIELEGACECSLACSTCHVVLEEKVYQSLPEPTDKENDMLDLAFGLTPSSRLGCQVILTEAMAGAVFTIPAATRNMYVDGHVPKPH